MSNELTELGLNLRVVDVDTLTPHPRNYNQHSESQVGELGQSLGDFGQYKNVVCWTDPDNGRLYILAGHGLLEAAKADKRERIAVNDRSDLTRAQAMALMFSDNFTTSTDFDYAMLSNLVTDEEFPKDVPGLSDEALAEILEMAKVEDEKGTPPDVEAQIDKAAELQDKWGVAEGDIWQAGPHYVICGDCRDPETWRRLLAKSGHEKVNGVFTSPPYAEQRKKQYGGTPVDEYVEWWDAVQESVRGNLADDGSFFVNIKPHCKDGERVLYVFDLVLAMRRRWGWRFVDEFVWKRRSYPASAPNRFKNAFEPVYHFAIRSTRLKFRPENVLGEFKSDSSKMVTSPKGAALSQSGSGFVPKPLKSRSGDGAWPSNLIEVYGDIGKDGHAAAFPVPLPDFFIRAYSDPGDVWIDPFCGSGTTIVAAHQADGGQRVGLGIEQLPKYVSVCLERFNNIGLVPKRLTQ